MIHRDASVLPVALRTVADAVMSTLALAATLVAVLLVRLGDQGAPPPGVGEFGRSVAYLAPALMLCTVSVYSAMGLYGRVRYLKGASKIAMLVAASSLAYLLFGVGQGLVLPDFALDARYVVLAWAIGTAMLLLSRYWSATFRAFALAEAELSRVVRGEAERDRILVIGGAGYIGSALLPKLLDRGAKVRILDLLLFGEEPIARYLDHPNLEVVRADFRQVDQVVAAMSGVHTVVHLGGLVGDPACSLDEGLTTEVNLDYTRLIAEVAKGWGVPRFVFASSCSVYGASDDVLDEGSDLNPVSLYARSKIASENVLFEMAGRKFAPIILRFGTIYGISGRPRFDLVVNLLSAKAWTEGAITVFGGDQWRPFVHVDDAAKAIVLALDAPIGRVRNEIYNVGSDGQNATLGDVGSLINELVPQATYVDSGHDGDRRNYRVDFSKIRKDLGFVPEWTLERGIGQVLEALRSGDVVDYKDPRYSNVRFLTEGMAPRFARVRKDWAGNRINGDVSHSLKGLADARLAADVDDRPSATAPSNERLPSSRSPLRSHS